MREKLWRLYIPQEMPTDLRISEIAEKYDGVSGSDISNAVLKAALKAAKNQESFVKQADFEDAVAEIVKSKKANKSGSPRDVKITKSEIVPESEVPKDIVNKSKEFQEVN